MNDATILLKKRLVIIATDSNHGAVRTLVYDVERESWDEIKTSKNIQADSASCVIPLCDGGAILVDSHRSKAYKTDHVLSGEWSAIEAPKEHRLKAVGICINDSVLLIGGERDGRNLSSVESYSLSKNEWTKESSLSKPAYLPAVCCSQNSDDGGVLVVGGKHDTFAWLCCIQQRDSNGVWQMRDGVLEPGVNNWISGCWSPDGAVICLSKKLVRLDSKLAKMQTLVEFTDWCHSDSMCIWNESFVCAWRNKVTLFDCSRHFEIKEFASLPLDAERSFVMAVNEYQ